MFDLVIAELVEAGSGHNHGVDRLFAEQVEAASENADP